MELYLRPTLRDRSQFLQDQAYELKIKTSPSPQILLQVHIVKSM